MKTADFDKHMGILLRNGGSGVFQEANGDFIIVISPSPKTHPEAGCAWAHRWDRANMWGLWKLLTLTLLTRAHRRFVAGLVYWKPDA